MPTAEVELQRAAVDYLIQWTSLVLIVSAVVASVILWSIERSGRVLLVTGLLIAIGAHIAMSAIELSAGGTIDRAAQMVDLAMAVLSLVAVLGLGRFLRLERRRRRATRRVQEALAEIEAGFSETLDFDFFSHATQRLTKILGVDFAFIGELREESYEVDVVAFSVRGAERPRFTYPLAGTPCETIVGKDACAYARDVQKRFPNDKALVDLGVEAYVGVPLFGVGGRPLGLLSIMHSEPLDDERALLPALRIIATRAEAELQREQFHRSLRRSEERYRALFEESLDARFITDPEGKMLEINRAGVELFGYESREQLLEEFVADAHYSTYTRRETVLEDLLENGSIRDYPVEILRRDGARLSARESANVERDANGKAIAIRGSLRDISRERELQRQLMSSQRMEAVGRMAGGVAHDFNNMLTVINGHSDMLLNELAGDSVAARSVKEIKAAALSAAAFTRRLLLLSRRKVLAPQRVDLNRVVRDLLLLLQKAVGEDVETRLELEEGLRHVIADAGEIEQVMLNLVINARDAMPVGGELSIATRTRELGESEALDRGVEPGEWVELRVTDSGVGIEPDVADHIFEPFFTTKDPSIGTGLGLSTVYGIIRQLGGDVAVESAPDKGTSFSLLIRPAPSGAEDGAVIRTGAPSARSPATLLVVDDEVAVRNLLRKSLERQGYNVVVAGDGPEALDRLGARGRVDLLIADVKMPGLRGDQLALMAREVQSDLRVLLLSGDTEVAELPPQPGAPSAFLAKPFSTEELGRLVRDLLDRIA